MRRTLSAMAIGCAVVMAMATPALAKGEGDEGLGFEAVAIVGPGLADPVSMAGDQALSYGDLARTFSGAKMTVRPTAIDLGPVYRVTYTIACPSSTAGAGVVTYHQELYPYASFGDFARAWTYTPAGQPTCGFMGSPGAGWMAASTDLTQALVDAGLPSSAPAVPAPAAPAPQSAPVPSDGIPVWVFAVLAAALTAALVGVGLRGRQGQRRRAAA